MNCQESQELLSIFVDGELDSERRVQLEVHIDGCPECLAKLAEIRGISSATKSLPVPSPTTWLWDRIEGSLTEGMSSSAVSVDSQSETGCKADHLSPSIQRYRVAILFTAALVLIGLGIGWGMRSSDQHSHDHRGLRAFIERFNSDPITAQKNLADNYSGHSVSASEAAQLVGFQPAASQSLPDGYKRDGIYVLDMPCCRCIEVLWSRDDGIQVAIFEHNEPLEDWFEGRPSVQVACAGKDCRLVEVGSHFAASWRVGNRLITVVGLRGTEELAALVKTLY